MKPHALPMLLCAAIACVFVGPALVELGRVVPGAPTSDTYDHLWGYWWYFHSLSQGELPLRTTVSHWPSGGLLWFIDPFGAMLSLPFQAVLGSAAGYTITVTIQVFLGLIAAYYVAFDATRDRAAALLGAVIFGASPYVLSLLYSGTMEYLNLAPLPLAWLAMRRALTTGERRWTLITAAMWAWATLGNFYYGAFVALLGGIALWAERGRGWMVIGERAAAIVLAWGLMVAPLGAIAAWTLTSSDAVVSSASAPGWAYQSLPATDLLTFLHPGEYYFPDNRATGNHGIIHVNYVGWVVVVVAAVGAWRAPALRFPLLAAAVLALGPSLCFHRQPVTIGPFHVPLPAALLYFPGSPFRLVHHPFRLVVLPMLFCALAAASATRGRPWLAIGLTGAVLVETLRFSPAVFPIPTSPAGAPALYTEIRDDATVRGLIDFPPNYHKANRRYEGLQTVHGKIIPYGVNAFLPEAFQDNHFVRALLQCLSKPALTAIPREGGRPLLAFLQRPVEAKQEDGRGALHAAGYDLVVLHLDALSKRETACARELMGGEPERTGEKLEAYRVR